MKKLVCLVMAAILLLSISSVALAEDWKFERKVEIICPWGVGGGADSSLRPMAQILKDILGVEVEVVNVEGGGGVNGVQYTYKQPADGYTFMLGTQSLIMQDLQGTTSMDFRTEFIPISTLMHSINIIAASKKSMDAKGISNFAEMIEYLGKNPYGVSVGMMTATGADGASLKQTLAGLDVLEISYSTGSEMNAALLGGHIDMMITGTDEIAGLIESGDILPFLALCENRMTVYPDMQCTGELEIDSFIGPWRAIFAKNGTPQAAIDAMVAAIEEARQTDAWKTFLHAAAYDERGIHANGEDLRTFFEAEYVSLSQYLKDEGVLAKDYYKQ